MHTTTQARDLWCPMVRIIFKSDTGFNRMEPTANGAPSTPKGCNCIADRCAMWRWGTKPDPYWERPRHAPASLLPRPHINADVGFCGLAGTPAHGV